MAAAATAGGGLLEMTLLPLGFTLFTTIVLPSLLKNRPTVMAAGPTTSRSHAMSASRPCFLNASVASIRCRRHPRVSLRRRILLTWRFANFHVFIFISPMASSSFPSDLMNLSSSGTPMARRSPRA
uniref:Uncharacterized protein n=1 Tax=Opuntia streptacantha TaxID=393608 RepID=A0A7C9EL75_OPUST